MPTATMLVAAIGFHPGGNRTGTALDRLAGSDVVPNELISFGALVPSAVPVEFRDTGQLALR